jgi:hypothetical protein
MRISVAKLVQAQAYPEPQPTVYNLVLSRVPTWIAFIAFANVVKLEFTWLELIVVPVVKVYGMLTAAYEITATPKHAMVSMITTCLKENLFLLKYVIATPFQVGFILSKNGLPQYITSKHRKYEILSFA